METHAHKLYEQTFGERYYAAIRNLGRVGLGLAVFENLQSLEKRRYDELTSGLAEALPGVVKTHWAFEPVDGKLVAKDGQTTEQLLINGLHDAIHKANHDSFYIPFLPARARHELDELREQEAMVNGRVNFNTIVTFSPYSEEYDTEETKEKLKNAAQDPDWQRAMIRVSHWDGEELHVFTSSSDNSDVSLLRETAKVGLGYEFNAEDSTAMLGERIHLDVRNSAWLDLADSITAQADVILSKRQGGEWHQGRPAAEAKDTQKYIESQTEIIYDLLETEKKLAAGSNSFKEYKKAIDMVMYDHAALLKRRIGMGDNFSIIDVAAASVAAGNISRANGEVFNMCGYVLEPGSTEAQMAVRTGFESLMRLLGKEVKCPACEKKVVVPANKLLDGRLACKKCGYEVDACTGKVYKKPKPQKNF